MWSNAVRTGDVRPLVMYINGDRTTFPVPHAGKIPAGQVLQKRAELRLKAYMNAGFEEQLPLLPSFDWEKLRSMTMDWSIHISPDLIAFTSPNCQIQDKKVKHHEVTKETFSPSSSL